VGYVAADAQGNIWVGNIAGVSKYNGTSWHWYTKADGLAGYSVLSIAQDKQGNMWFGTSDGLSRFNGTTWTSYFTNTQVNAVAVDANGAVWAALTYQIVNDNRVSAGVAKFDGETWTTFNKTNSGLVDNTVLSIAIDADDNKWLGTMGGITKLQDHPDNK
jgi:ligand-binding sensor domain-containing protein